jgi:hypothetical protein
MTELKTLKDLKIIYQDEAHSETGKLTFKQTAISLEDLKAEAVKLVKEFKKQNGKQPRDSEFSLDFGNIIDSEKTKSQFSEMDYSNEIKILMHFFNLTEDDLQ